MALEVGAKGAYTRGHAETCHVNACLPELAPRPEVGICGALACKAPDRPDLQRHAPVVQRVDVIRGGGGPGRDAKQVGQLLRRHPAPATRRHCGP